jgi:hypothetical protein
MRNVRRDGLRIIALHLEQLGVALLDVLALLLDRRGVVFHQFDL